MNRTPEHLAAQLLRPSGEETVPLDADEFALAEAAVLQALATRRPETHPMKSWQQPRAWMALAAALAFTVAGAWWWKTSASPLPHVSEAALATLDGLHAVETGASIAEGQVLSTPEQGHAAIRFAEGTQLSLGEKSSLAVQGIKKHRRFNLLRGRVFASVVKLKKDEQFEVATNHATVSVRGTRFAVEVEPPSASCEKGATSVSVEEGLVAVTSGGQEKLVKPGEQLRVGCDSTTATPEATEPHEKLGRPPRAPHHPSASSLARMNEQYAKAMKLKRAGHWSAAARVLRELRRTYPAGPLDEAAAVEELRLLERVNPHQAKAAAQEYLEDYPQGYARDIAHKLSEAP